MPIPPPTGRAAASQQAHVAGRTSSTDGGAANHRLRSNELWTILSELRLCFAKAGTEHDEGRVLALPSSPFSQVSDAPMLLLLEGDIVEASHAELCRLDDGQPATIVFVGITQPALK